ncbi:hypothetical protein [Roseinatronobacter alkalisoli]|uniref:O-antigen ligase family protein n=1 Tax=Roseinatronobacter alkalisoli TaxID=3028235 RepID=A0ABT5T976_9RHOB|nr:hypothetical protein [Roseinatronobacter sp. HJB301]MDD7971541.1 hypothetical protein [Roseinatronobacter sp. HJB301]
MPSIIAYAALLIWPFVIVAMFRKMAPERAFIWAILGGYMALPELTEFNLPVIPAFDKTSIPNLTAFALCLVMLKMRPGLLPDGLLGKALVVVLCAAPVIAVFFNTDPLVFGMAQSGRLTLTSDHAYSVPGMRIYDSVSMLVRQLIMILPFFMARHLLASEQALTELLRALMIAGLIYSVPIMWEVRFSPQLHTDIYGFFQHDFQQMMREGGYRPIVFMPHGLWLSLFMVMTAVSALYFAKQATPSDRVRASIIAVYLFVMVNLTKSLGPLLILLTISTLVVLLKPRMQLRVAGLMALLTLSYPLLRGAGLVPTDKLVELASQRSQERAQSLQFRFDNEDLLLDRAAQKPLFGWGGYGRNQIFDPQTGEMISISDGQWVITIGQWGWVGYLALFGLLCLPLLALLWRYRQVPDSALPPQAGVLALILGASLVDLLPNATLVSLTWLIAGALLGHAELQNRRSRTAQLEHWRNLPGRAGLMSTARTSEPALKRSFL